MNSSFSDLKSFFSTLEECHGCNFSEHFSSYTDYLSIGKIEDYVYFKGKLTVKNEDYISDDIGSDYFEVEVCESGIIKIVVRFTYKQFPPEYTPDQLKFMTVFKNSVANKIASFRLSEQCIYFSNFDLDFDMYNQNYLFMKIEEMFSSGCATEYAAAFVNIKHVNQLNRYFGSDIAGAAIRAFGQKLNTFPDEDKGELAVHLGGDNFATLIRLDRISEFEHFIASVPVTISYEGDNFEHVFTTRAGITNISSNHRYPNHILGECSLAYNYAKNNGLDIVHYSDSINENFQDFTETLTKALNENKILIYFQPVISYGDAPVMHSAEALARWLLDGKVVSPKEFINLATDSGLVSKIDFYILEKVCKSINSWKERDLPLVPVSVNFSGRNLINSSVADEILEIIDRYGVDHNLIGIEFSEPDFNQRMPLLNDVTQTLSEAGVLVTLDKFSTGQSTLTILHDIEADYVKISADRFDSDDPKGLIIANDMLNLANLLGFKVICEGISSQKQANDLYLCGCTLFQSYFYDKPLSERFFVNRLENPTYTVEGPSFVPDTSD